MNKYLIETISEILLSTITSSELHMGVSQTPGFLLYSRDRDLYFELIKVFRNDYRFKHYINSKNNDRFVLFIKYLNSVFDIDEEKSFHKNGKSKKSEILY